MAVASCSWVRRPRPAGQYLADLAELAFGLGQCLVEAAGLAGVELGGVGQHAAVAAAQRIDGADLDRV